MHLNEFRLETRQLRECNIFYFSWKHFTPLDPINYFTQSNHFLCANIHRSYINKLLANVSTWPNRLFGRAASTSAAPSVHQQS